MFGACCGFRSPGADDEKARTVSQFQAFHHVEDVVGSCVGGGKGHDPPKRFLYIRRTLLARFFASVGTRTYVFANRDVAARRQAAIPVAIAQSEESLRFTANCRAALRRPLPLHAHSGDVADDEQRRQHVLVPQAERLLEGVAGSAQVDCESGQERLLERFESRGGGGRLTECR